ncbi:hypothetical protein KEF29_03230 [Streptomyces tuirus]|uniref:Lipoprotein n=1 Tax=Streptomyces tuirus TaxID=68278 RepID=A0A941F9D9_9ACTN|nr:hypothetical protein [Streptomyces tuirus]
MRRHIITITAVALLAAGCSSASGDKPEVTPTAEASVEAAAESSAPAEVKLSEEWVPKLEAALGKTEANICKEVGAPKCVKFITELTSVVYAVGTAIEEAGAELDYPRSMKDVETVEKASEAYVDAECKGSTELTLGDSVCAGYTATLMVTPATLQMNLTTDELS